MLYKWPGIIFCCLVLLAVSGCGGGGGSAEVDGVDPAEAGVRSELDSLAANIVSRNITAAMNSFDSNLKYYPANPAIIGGHEDYNQFRTRLTSFLNGVNVGNCNFTSFGISISFDTVAMARGMLNCSYIDANQSGQNFSEQIEMRLEKTTGNRWGITEFYAYDSQIGQTGTQFPPQP
jgi:hypothetical protein